jgi:hypothetical protein
MVRALRANAKGNLFLKLNNRTIISIKMGTVSSGGEQLVTIKYGGKPKHAVGVHNYDMSKSNMTDLAAAWNVRKLNQKTKAAGVLAVARYALEAGDKIYLHYYLRNKGGETLSIRNVDLQMRTLGGIKGKAVLDVQRIPSSNVIDARVLGPGDEASGTIIFPKVYVDHDQELVIRVKDDRDEGPDIRVRI